MALAWEEHAWTSERRGMFLGMCAFMGAFSGLSCTAALLCARFLHDGCAVALRNGMMLVGKCWWWGIATCGVGPVPAARAAITSAIAHHREQVS